MTIKSLNRQNNMYKDFIRWINTLPVNDKLSTGMKSNAHLVSYVVQVKGAKQLHLKESLQGKTILSYHVEAGQCHLCSLHCIVHLSNLQPLIKCTCLTHIARLLT